MTRPVIRAARERDLRYIFAIELPIVLAIG
jgi:hypothetical protein